jgi:rod shape determining protein RodA
MSFGIDRRSLENFDWTYLGAVLAIACVGILNLYSAGYGLDAWKLQLYWFILGLGFMFLVVFFDYHRVERLAIPAYVLCMGLLVLVLFYGEQVRGSRSWLDLGYFHIQPSELAKIGLVLVLSRYWHREKTSGPGVLPRPYYLREILLPLFLIALPAGLVMLEPDMGTALVIILVGGTMILFMGISRRAIILLAILFAISLYPSWRYVLRPHQKDRLITFIHPEKDPLGVGYNLLQSKIAIGSGGWQGKGFTRGTQNMLRFLPEQQTDFAFSVWAEEWGFRGLVPILLLYLFIIIRGIGGSSLAKDRIGAMLALGAIFIIFWHALINLAMITGMFPVIGVPLPFFSYGGSHLITTMMAVGIILNVRMRRYVF